MFDFIKNEHEVLKRWRDADIFARIKAKNPDDSPQRYCTLDGPITANGSMCIHHVWGRTLKDAMLKYHTLKGRSAQFQNGFDAQGMWVEVEVEKLLGLNDKKAIMDYGLDKFTEKCIERVKFFAEMQKKQSIRLGQIMDWDNSYFTNSDHNIESIWYFLKKCHERGMLVRSYKSMPWCPRCGTSLSEHEMIGSYKELTHKAVFAKIKLSSGEKLLIWTTTPWTLAANVSIAVNPNHRYLRVRVKSDPDLLIVGKDALKIIPKKDIIAVESEIAGTDLLGKTYDAILPLKIQNFEHKVIPWDEVSAADGTGAVHIAPGCGAEDFELGKKFDLKQIVPINEAGRFMPEFEFLSGMSTEECEKTVFDTLKKCGKLLYVQDFTHNYPFCWRCKTNVVFKLVEGWDIATAPIKPALMRVIPTVNWQPAFLQKTMENWLENMGDWNISRRRFYGLPLPIYPCKCGHTTVVESVAELTRLAVNPELVKKIPHLHRPYIDEIKIKCAKCGGEVSRVADVGDCWLDAGITPFSTKKYFTDKKYWKHNFPSQAVIEMKEQIRLWFYSMYFMSVVMEDCSPFETCVGYGTILDEEGKKFSKTGKNNIKFDDAAETFGADCMRYLFAGSNPVNDMRFGPNLIDEARKKLLALYNACVFFDTYASIDKPDLTDYVPRKMDITDVWLAAVLNDYIAACEQSYEEFKPHEVVERTEKLVEDLSNFYIRVNRRRFWKNDNGTDKMNAYWSLYNAVTVLATVMAPIVPFLAEHIWSKTRNYVKTSPEFILLADFPTEIKCGSMVEGNITERVKFVQEIISLAHALRAREQLKLKQPLRTLYIKTTDRAQKETVIFFRDVLLDEINVKKIETVETDGKFNLPYLTVNFKTAGAHLKGEVQKLKDTLAALDDTAMQTAAAAFEKGKVTVGAFKDLPANLFERKLKSKPEYVSVTQNDLTVVLDTTLDDELVALGHLREIIRAVQLARQEADLNITTRIKLCLQTKNAALSKIIADNRETICAEVLAVELSDTLKGHKFTIDIDGEKIAGVLCGV